MFKMFQLFDNGYDQDDEDDFVESCVDSVLLKAMSVAEITR